MSIDDPYTLSDLAGLADVTPRTVRYYIGQGLLPPAGQSGPGARYGENHLARLRLIRQLQRQHLPLAEIRSRLSQLADEAVGALAVAESTAQAGHGAESAADYIKRVLARVDPIGAPRPDAVAQMLLEPSFLGAEPPGLRERAMPILDAAPAAPLESPASERSQWDRIALDPDVELHIRRPLSRTQNKRVERLIAIAREVLEENDK